MIHFDPRYISMGIREEMLHEILAVIPAKGTSKGLPGKNLYPLFGKPLVQWTIEASIRSSYVTRTVVSSDSAEILNLAQGLGAEIIERPAELATDTAGSESVMEHALDCLTETKDYTPDALVLLQPTSPLRTSEDIDGALALYFEQQCTAIISGYELERNPLKEFLIGNDGLLSAILDDGFPFMPRQHLPRAFRPNGAIYVVETDSFMRTGSLLTDDTRPFHMDEEASIDIDCMDDLIAAEKYLSRSAVVG